MFLYLLHRSTHSIVFKGEVVYSMLRACWNYYSNLNDVTMDMKDLHVNLLDKVHSPKHLMLTCEDAGNMLHLAKHSKLEHLPANRASAPALLCGNDDEQQM